MVSMAVVIWMLSRVTHEIDHATRMRIVYAAIIIFAFRAVPGVGDGYRWFTIDVLGFDEAFFGVLRQIGAGIAIVARLAAVRRDHAQAGGAGAALDHDAGHDPVAAVAAAGVPAAHTSPSSCSASARAASPCSMRPRRRRSPSSA